MKKKGPLEVRQGLYPKEHRNKARFAWRHMQDRCYNEKNDHYKSYGAKGIKVLMCRSDFINWYCSELSKWPYEIKTASVGRINHNEGYFLKNLIVQSVSDNSKESHTRRNDYSFFTMAGSQKNKKSILIKDFKTNEPIMIFDSLAEASKLIGCAKENISRVALRKGKNKSFKNRMYSAEYI